MQQRWLSVAVGVACWALGAVAQAQPDYAAEFNSRRDEVFSTVARAEQDRRAGRCEQRRTSLRELERWVARLGGVSRDTQREWFDLIAAQFVLPCPATAPDGTGAVVGGATAGPPGTSDMPGMQLINRFQGYLRDAQIRCDSERFEAMRQALLGLYDEMLRYSYNTPRLTEALRRQRDAVEFAYPPRCDNDGIDDTTNAATIEDGSSVDGSDGLYGGPGQPLPPSSPDDGDLLHPEGYQRTTIEPPGMPSQGRVTRLRAGYIRLETARRECSQDDFESARRELIDAIGDELRQSGVGQNREAELIRERERIRGLVLDRCDNLEPPIMRGEHPPGRRSGEQPGGAVWEGGTGAYGLPPGPLSDRLQAAAQQCDRDGYARAIAEIERNQAERTNAILESRLDAALSRLWQDSCEAPPGGMSGDDSIQDPEPADPWRRPQRGDDQRDVEEGDLPVPPMRDPWAQPGAPSRPEGYPGNPSGQPVM